MKIGKIKRSGWVTAIAAVAAVGLLAGCSTGTGGNSASVKGGTVTVRMFADWGNPVDGGQTVTSTEGILLSQAMYSTLAYLDLKTNKVVPYLASSWKTTPDSVTFTIRKGETCSDGSPITADTVYKSFQRLVNPKTASIWPSSLFGPGPYTLSKDTSANTFTFKTPNPNASLISGFADARGGIICGAGLDAGANFATASYGSGAFIYKSSVQGTDYIVKKNPKWVGPEGMKTSDSGFPSEIDFKVITDPTTAANELVTGEVDLTAASGQDVTRLASDPKYTQQLAPGYAPYILMLNQAPQRVTASKDVRLAVMTALDPKLWTAAMGEPKAVISTNVQANPGGYCYSNLSSLLPKPSVKAAQTVLTNAGYTLGSDGTFTKDGKPLTINVLGSTSTGQAAEYMSDTLKKVGFTVDFTNVDLTTFATDFNGGNYDVTIGLFGSQTPGSPAPTAQFLTGKTPAQGGLNFLGWTDPMAQQLSNAAFGAATKAASCTAWKAFNTYMIKDAAASPWSSAINHWFSRAGEFSYVPSLDSLIPFTIRRLK